MTSAYEERRSLCWAYIPVAEAIGRLVPQMTTKYIFMGYIILKMS